MVGGVGGLVLLGGLRVLENLEDFQEVRRYEWSPFIMSRTGRRSEECGLSHYTPEVTDDGVSDGRTQGGRGREEEEMVRVQTRWNKRTGDTGQLAMVYILPSVAVLRSPQLMAQLMRSSTVDGTVRAQLHSRCVTSMPDKTEYHLRSDSEDITVNATSSVVQRGNSKAAYSRKHHSMERVCDSLDPKPTGQTKTRSQWNAKAPSRIGEVGDRGMTEV
ncbi:hypothetical protein C8F01DRAFT_313951 [Mycena amicta]|nr:hypothetical protein C8F01DRAFT_313951 [Mycena amicta]